MEVYMFASYFENAHLMAGTSVQWRELAKEEGAEQESYRAAQAGSDYHYSPCDDFSS